MTCILHISVPCPLRQLFDYTSDLPISEWEIGARVKINFANRLCTGIVVKLSEVKSDTDITKLKAIEEKLDDKKLIPDELMQTLLWVSRYYHHPLGECFQTALPKLLRTGKPAELDNNNSVWIY